MNHARAFLVVCWVALSFIPGAVAHAQEGTPGLKSPQTALLLSFFGTAIPVGVGISLPDEEDAVLTFLTGAVIGPSLGHIYAGRPGRAMGGIAVRTLAVVGIGAAFQMSLNGSSGDGDVLGFTSLALGAGMVVYDIVGAPGSANAYNEALLAKRVSVMPALLGEERAPGFRVVVSY